MSANPYVYTKLDKESRQIRLIHVLPGGWKSPISCELYVVSLDEAPAYQILSYVWGDPKISERILLPGCGFRVTTNLYAALRRLRLSNETRIIWIDALCINQLD